MAFAVFQAPANGDTGEVQIHAGIESGGQFAFAAGREPSLVRPRHKSLDASGDRLHPAIVYRWHSKFAASSRLP
jgi:hypothetical protein